MPSAMDRTESFESLASRVAEHASKYLTGIGDRPVRATLSGDELRERLGGPLPVRGEDPVRVLDAIAEAGRGGTVASQGPRYFGFVTGGSIPQRNGSRLARVGLGPERADVRHVADCGGRRADRRRVAAGTVRTAGELERRVRHRRADGELHRRSPTARHHLLQQAGWDVERHGLFGAPPIEVIVSDESHRTIFTALRMLGLGAERVKRVETDAQGRMRPGAPRADSAKRPRTVHRVFADRQREHGRRRSRPGDRHADSRTRSLASRRRGFGLWAAASPALRHLTSGIERADSLATDGHKWLNVPYDSGLVLTAHPESHQQSMLVPAHYIQATPGERDPRAFTPDESRRARAVPIYAALRVLGVDGVSEIVDRCCAMARRMAMRLANHACVRILNDVVLNQVLVQFRPADGDDEAAAVLTQRVIGSVQQEGTCWAGGTKWHGPGGHAHFDL